MRCTSYCIAAAFDMARLRQHLGTEAQAFPNALHLLTATKSLFCYAYGVIVFWNYSKAEEAQLLQQLRPYGRELLPQPEHEEFNFRYGSSFRIEREEIILHDQSALIKLAVSYGMAQSIKLDIFEQMMRKTIAKTQKLPLELAKKGRILLSRREIAKRIGEVVVERNFINLHTDILDSPDFFWENSELETYFLETIHYLDVRKRTEILNRRLSILHDLFDILSDELKHQHSMRLEWTIIVLIVIEIVLALLRDVLHWL